MPHILQSYWFTPYYLHITLRGDQVGKYLTTQKSLGGLECGGWNIPRPAGLAEGGREAE